MSRDLFIVERSNRSTPSREEIVSLVATR